MSEDQFEDQLEGQFEGQFEGQYQGRPSGMYELSVVLGGSFLDSLPVSGVALSALNGSQQETSLYASDDTAAWLDEVQFDLGEGPRWDAARSRTPVLLPYAQSMASQKWPMFAQALARTQVQALFVFPMRVGAIDIGVVELHATRPGELTDLDLASAHALADRAAWALMRQVLTVELAEYSSADPSTDPHATGFLASRREIHQATGMVLAQTGGSAADALLLLRGHAFASGRSVQEVAEDVLGKRLKFTPPNL